jgi:hypothetical protein
MDNKLWNSDNAIKLPPSIKKSTLLRSLNKKAVTYVYS